MTPTEIVDSVYDAFTRGDITHIVGLVAPAAVWRQSSMLPWGGTYSGPSGAAEFFSKLNAAAETTGFAPRENVAVGQEVFSFGTSTGTVRSTGKSATMDWMFRWRVDGGKITLFDSYVDSAVVIAAMSRAAATLPHAVPTGTPTDWPRRPVAGRCWNRVEADPE